jgi:hypothetical protein
VRADLDSDPLMYVITSDVSALPSIVSRHEGSSPVFARVFFSLRKHPAKKPDMKTPIEYHPNI